MVRVKRVSFKEDENGRRYPYVDIGHEAHGRKSYRLWISGRLLERDEEGNYVITFPKRKARVEKTPKGSLVLRPSDDTMVYKICVGCGYRGRGDFEILSENMGIFPFEIWSSPRGSLGVSRGALVNTPDGKPLKYRWHRTGRLYGSPSMGITIVMPDGTGKEFDEVPDGLEALQELPKLEEDGND